MVGEARRAGLTLGAIGIGLSLAGPAASEEPRQDLRASQALVEAPLFLSAAEVDAAFARLDAARGDTPGPVPKAMTYWETGAASHAQGERAGRIGAGASATQMRLGADREVRPGLVVGAMASAGFGSIGSGDLNAAAYGRHADFYAKFGAGRVFAKALVGASQFGLNAIERGSAGAQCRADASGVVARVAGQLGGSASVAGVTLTPSLTLSGFADRVSAYSERGEGGLAYSARNAGAAIGAARLAASRLIALDQKRKLKLEAFVGTEKVLAYRVGALRASADGRRVRVIGSGGTPTGRGLVGGLGLGTSLTDGVTLSVNYDYGRRDGVSTRSTRGRLGVAF